jgi:hypothetical protein
VSRGKKLLFFIVVEPNYNFYTSPLLVCKVCCEPCWARPSYSLPLGTYFESDAGFGGGFGYKFLVEYVVFPAVFLLAGHLVVGSGIVL